MQGSESAHHIPLDALLVERPVSNFCGPSEHVEQWMELCD